MLATQPEEHEVPVDAIQSHPGRPGLYSEVSKPAALRASNFVVVAALCRGRPVHDRINWERTISRGGLEKKISRSHPEEKLKLNLNGTELNKIEIVCVKM